MAQSSSLVGQYGKVVILLVCVIIILQGLHMMILMKLERKGNQRMSGSVEKGLHPREQDDAMPGNPELLKIQSKQWTKAADKIMDSHIIDSSGNYMVVPNIIQGRMFQKQTVNDVTLCTQGTANNLHHLSYLSNRWQGPISVTVFTTDKDVQFAIRTMIYLHSCFQSVANNITFHIAFPITHRPSNLHLTATPNLPVDCGNTDFFNKEDNTLNYEVLGIEYPNNFLRNVAIQNSKTLFVFVIDIDMIPSTDLHSQFKEFMHRSGRLANQPRANENITFVVPTFESKLNSYPGTKKDLLNQWAQNAVRPFYREVCWKCQKPTEYDHWQNLPALDFMDIGYTVDWIDPWEPFYISKRSMPHYDERFRQYGFNRISQVCELYMAGYKFVVLNNAFLIHRGFKVNNEFHSSKTSEQEKNKALFHTFKEELKTVYSWSNRQC